MPDAAKRSTTFIDNLSLPVHRWFRYSAGFSAQWVAKEIESRRGDMANMRVLDPFCGAGTVPLEAAKLGHHALGVEAHPFVSRIARAKLNLSANAGELMERAGELLEVATRILPGATSRYPVLIHRCFPEESLNRLDRLRIAWVGADNGDATSELLWLALTGILRSCSPVGTAQWQYVLPNKSKASAMDPFEAFRGQVEMFANDLRFCQLMIGNLAEVEISEDDARSCESVPDHWATLVLTSPPYMNNYDYADATRLEMSFWRQIERWGDLHQSVRRRLMRSCTQHVDADKSKLDSILSEPLLDPIRDELKVVCDALSEVRLTKGGKKSYHTMTAAYFADLARTWVALRRKTTQGAEVCFVIGDSAPYGVHVPVEEWLGRLAVASGFKGYEFKKLRDRNVKWKNRKHRVPLKEGQLWVQG